MAEDHAPPVVAVVVTSDPGPWLEESLEALRRQDYESLSVLVVDAASDPPLAPRVAAVVPEAFVWRCPDNLGFGPCADVVLEVVEGAAFYLFCHDDVVPEEDAVRRLVEEAFRSNAGVVAPKLVAYDEPDRLLQVGLGMDRFGAPIRRVARWEFDQRQHDEAREVFAAPGGCTLVRADLFHAIGGYDARINMFGEDVDLCWRARIAGARVAVAPQARVRHREATASRQRPLPEARALQWRHELRAVLKNYAGARRVLTVGALAVLSVLEIAYFAALGKRWRVRQVIDAWRWNLAPEQDLRRARAEVSAYRRIPDRVVAKLFTRRSMRLTRFVRPMIEDLAERWSEPRRGQARAGDHRRPAPALRPTGDRPPRARLGRLGALGAVLALVLLLFGSRELLVGNLPLVGGLLPIPSPATLIGHYLGGWTDAGLQRPGPATPAFAMLGLAGIVLAGGMGVVLKVSLVAAVALGAVGVARLLRPFGPVPARVAGALAYLYLPLAWNDLGRGDVTALAAYAGLPWAIARLARATGLEPFSPPADGEGPPGGGRLGLRARLAGAGLKGVAAESLGLGVLLAVVGSFSPPSVLAVLACAATIALGALASGRAGAGLRTLAVAAGSTAVAFVLAFPWSLTFVQAGARWSALSGASAAPDRSPRLSSLLSLAVGPVGRGPLVWAFLVAAAFVLVAGRGARFEWAARLWVVTLGSVALAWSGAEGWLGLGGGELRALLAPAAACIAALVGLGWATLAEDVRVSGFGWRHAAALVFGAASLAGSLPVLGSTLSGRWGLPATGYDTVLSWLETGHRGGPLAGKVLWLGDPRALPLTGWEISPGLSAGVGREGLPDATRLWPSADPGEANAIVSDVVSAEVGRTIRLGHLLAASGVRYVVVPSALAPEPPGGQRQAATPPPVALRNALGAQIDLHELPGEGGVAVYANLAWTPAPAAHRLGAPAAGTPAVVRGLGVAAALACWLGVLWLYLRRRRRSRARRHSPRPPSPGRLSATAPSASAPPSRTPVALEPVGAGR